MPKSLPAAAATSAMIGTAMAQDRIRISSAWGEVAAVPADNAAARELPAILPLTLGMSDHLRREKTGRLPPPCPTFPGSAISPSARWVCGAGAISYLLSQRSRPPPGIVVLGQVDGDVSIFDRPGDITVELAHPE